MNKNRLKQRFTEFSTGILYTALGYQILQKNVSINGVEVDLLARHRQKGVWHYVLIEVKVRQFHNGAEAITLKQRARLTRAATAIGKRTHSPVQIDAALWQPRWPFFTRVQNIS